MNAERDIAQVMELAGKLWEKFAVNDEQANVWYMALREYTVAEAAGALRDHAAHSRFQPKPAEIRDRCAAHRDRELRDRGENDRWQATDALRSEIEIDRMQTDALCDAMDPALYARHVAALHAADWRLVCVRPGTRSERSIVACRVEAGVEPDDPDPMMSVPRRMNPINRGNVDFTRIVPNA